jgi:hypothetical protein
MAAWVDADNAPFAENVPPTSNRPLTYTERLAAVGECWEYQSPPWMSLGGLKLYSTTDQNGEPFGSIEINGHSGTITFDEPPIRLPPITSKPFMDSGSELPSLACGTDLAATEMVPSSRERELLHDLKTLREKQEATQRELNKSKKSLGRIQRAAVNRVSILGRLMSYSDPESAATSGHGKGIAGGAG